MEIAKVNLPEQIRLGQGDPTLVLNGAGIRYKFVFKIYIGALYLPQPQHEAEAVIATPGPKRILMHFLYDKVKKQDLDSAWREGFEANHDAAALARLNERIQAFSALFTDLVKGDRIWLDAVPGETRVAINERVVGTIPGDDFYPALLRIWIGDEPVTTALKQSMLGLD